MISLSSAIRSPSPPLQPHGETFVELGTGPLQDALVRRVANQEMDEGPVLVVRGWRDLRADEARAIEFGEHGTTSIVPPSHRAATAVRVKTWPMTAPRSTTPFEVAGNPSRRARSRASSVAGTGHSSGRRDPPDPPAASGSPRSFHEATSCSTKSGFPCAARRTRSTSAVSAVSPGRSCATSAPTSPSGNGSRRSAAPTQTREADRASPRPPAVPPGRPRSTRPGPCRRDVRRTGPTSGRPTGRRR